MKTRLENHIDETVSALAALFDAAPLPAIEDEDRLQVHLSTLLQLNGWSSQREVRLSDGRSRIDLVVDTGAALFGIETKVKGSASQVLRQLDRYAACPELAALLLVTTRSAHHHVPRALNGKPLRLVSYVEAGL